MSLPFPALRPFSKGDVWAQTAAEAASFDAWAITEVGVPQSVLMENAGRSAAAVVHRLFPNSCVVGMIGRGNNGGDALVALRTLQSWGYRVQAVLVEDRNEPEPLLHGWSLPTVCFTEQDDDDWREALGQADVVVDGILGTGGRGAPRTKQAAAIRRLNESGVPVVSLDVPSGVDASSGEVAGEAVRAFATVAFGAPKLGALLHPARAYVGRHLAVEIGFPPSAAEGSTAMLITPNWARGRLPVRETDTHKNRVGRVLIVGGQVGMAGAVVLAARAAFNAGAGLVRVCSVSANRDLLQAAVPEAIYVDADDRPSLDAAIASSDAIAVGPGLGTDAHALATMRHVIAASRSPLLLDADALNLAAQEALDLGALGTTRPLLITPHPGEMGRLMKGEDIPIGRIATAASAAERFACAVLYKGAPSLVAVGGRPVAVDTQGSSDLAVAGMGDTLAGVCVSLMAQGVEPATAASVGLYISGRAAKLAGRGVGLTPSDVVQWLPEALSEGGETHSDLELPFVTFDADRAV